ncbi:putative calcium-transporting ATPase 13, plasma membrane-type [Juglans microcarpa x Juglans regia]|uniref:putative calcium-transporting ATPase 13, plasma membrane-type n=1 Tax=Juglans microcarpa x Juglans regia TaxID=2249226 RepID=UPI001B7E5582|nr:putative calcium-transporting ATPase 13, plasma membrane-type [Juglans microcarpa x Juglans regia]
MYASSGHQKSDHERQMMVIQAGSNGTTTPRERWRLALSILRERNLLVSKPAANKLAEMGSLNALHGVSSSNDDIGAAATAADPHITLGSAEISSASPHVSINVNLDDEIDNHNNDPELQRASIARIVTEKDLRSLQKFGGVQGIAKALNTDLQNGIPGDETPAHYRFFQFNLKYWNRYIIVLLSLSAVLSLVFGIVEEGPKTGWYEGAIIIFAILILEVAPSVRNFCLELSWKILEKQKPLEMQPLEVNVFRRGCVQKISICKVLLGDIVCLDGEYNLVPANGLFISGESLKLDGELQTIINDENPFMLCGAKVIDGSGRMLVTSVGMDTTWGGDHLMHFISDHATPFKTTLPAELENVSSSIQITGLLIYILLLVVLFLRFKLGRDDVNSNLPELKGKPTEITDMMNKVFMKPNAKIAAMTTSLAMPILVGVMEGVPFVIKLAITFWNRRMLSGKDFAQNPFACLSMGSVTNICFDQYAWPTLDQLGDNKCLAETRNAIKALKRAGISIILISEDEISEVEAIALNCEMFPCSNGMVLEGKDFRNYSKEERMNNVDNITVMRSSSPSDKLLLVKCLKEKGRVVAMVVGYKTNDIPSIREANVGIVMGSSEIPKEYSDIVIMERNFSFLVEIVRCGRCIHDNIRKYIQLQLTQNIAGLLITAITTVCLGYSPITTIQLLWANLVVAFLGGLALLTEPPTDHQKLMNKWPLRQHKPLITKAMWGKLFSQTLYQTAILVTFQFKGQAILRVCKNVSETMIFNSFVLCQVFNLVNAREPEKKNMFRGIHRNRLFVVAVIVTLVLQFAFIEIENILAGNAKLNWVQWVACLVIGMVSWAIDWGTKCIPGYVMGLVK